MVTKLRFWDCIPNATSAISIHTPDPSFPVHVSVSLSFLHSFTALVRFRCQAVQDTESKSKTSRSNCNDLGVYYLKYEISDLSFSVRL